MNEPTLLFLSGNVVGMLLSIGLRSIGQRMNMGKVGYSKPQISDIFTEIEAHHLLTGVDSEHALRSQEWWQCLRFRYGQNNKREDGNE